jgi:hypothetical protein
MLFSLVPNMDKKITVSTEEEVKLRKSFEFGAYLLITHYLVKNHGIDELERFARFWAETAASQERRNLIAKSQREFLESEAKIEKVWVGRKPEKLDAKGYIGVVEKCPIRLMSNRHREDLPSDYFCDNICSIIYPYGYELLGIKGSIEKTDEGCRLVIGY